MRDVDQQETTAVWKQRFYAPKILDMRLAAAADCGLVVSNHTGSAQLYAWQVATGDLQQLTQHPTGVYNGVIAPDGRSIYYLDDHEGNEIGHYVRVPVHGGPPEDLTPALPHYSSTHLAVCRSGRLIAFDLTTPDGMFLYCIQYADDGILTEPMQLTVSPHYAFGPALSYDGKIAVWASTERTGKPLYSLVAFDTTTGERIAELWDGPEASLVWGSFAPLPGDTRLLATSDRTGVRRPFIWNPQTNERVDLALDALAGDVLPLDWSPDGQSVLLSQMHRAVTHLYLYNVATATVRLLQHPTGTFETAAFASPTEIFAVWEDATHPPQLIALDSMTGSLTRTLLAAGPAIPGHPWRSITFHSSDGEEIQGWLAVPPGDGPFPTVINCHGGPDMVVREAFAPMGQSWVDHGFAYLTINYRGSTTFGRTFEYQIWGNPGHWEVEDVVAARTWLVDQGIARDDQILLTGWSYGAFLTLLALGKYPDLWAGGMAGAAITNWTTQYEDASDTFKAYQAAFFGGTPDEKAEQYAASSPSTYVAQVTAPVLIIQGRNDTRTPARPVEDYVKQLRSLGRNVAVHWFNAGHVGKSVEQQIDHQLLMLQFADRVLTGQMSATESV